MAFSDLRGRFLLAMGLPLWGGAACAPAQPPVVEGGAGAIASDGAGDQAPSGQRFAEPPGGGSSKDPQIAADPPAGGRCGRDEVREVVCGATGDPGTGIPCGDSGANLASFGASRLVTRISGRAHDPALKDFRFSLAETDAYRRTIRGSVQPLPEYCCYDRCTPLTVAPGASTAIPPGFMPSEQCMSAPEGGTSAPAAGDAACPAAVQLSGQLRPFSRRHGDTCCYTVLVPQPDPPRHRRGRAARVDGVARTAGVAPASRLTFAQSWRDPALHPRVAHLDDATRARLAAAWTEDARLEHASVAAFAKTSLELLALGAPAELVAAAHAAAADEIQHARACFALASAYAGRDLGPAPFAEAARMAPLTALDRVALETLHDGCVAETVAAVEAREAARLAGDPAVRATLAQIADDEARHAELAWQILAWALRTGGAEVAAAIERASAALRVELDARRIEEPEPEREDAALEPHGRLGAGARARLAAGVMDQVVLPCLSALLPSV